MKFLIKHIILLSAVALACQSSIVLAEEAAVISETDAAVEPKVEVAVDVAVDVDADAGKQCAAADDGDCAPRPAAGGEDEEDPKCPSRPHVIRCAAAHLDTNRNGALEREELDDAIGGVSWILRGLLNVIGSVDAIMKKCDADGDGKITIEEDMRATEETCLATCFKRKAFKSLFFPECTE